MSADRNAQAVGELYAAFGRGDIPAILSKLADDVAWDDFAGNSAHAAGVPWLAPRNDREGVGEFFSIIGGWEFHSFEVKDILASANQAVAEIEVDVTLPNGTRFQDQEIHLWSFDSDGQVTRFRHYTDTAKHTAAAGVAAAV